MFPTLSEAVTGERLTVGPPFFNKWMVPIGLILLFLTGVGPLLAWRKSTRRQPARPVPVAGRPRRSSTAVALRRARRPRLGVGPLLRALRASCSARSCRSSGAARTSAAGAPAPICFTAIDRPRRPQQAPLRRLHRPRRHRADLPRLRRRGLQAGRAGAAEAGRADDGRQLHRPQRRAEGHRRRPEADDHRAHHRVRGRQADRDDVSGAVVLPQAREEPTTEVAIRRTFAEDLYLVLRDFEVADQTASSRSSSTRW